MRIATVVLAAGGSKRMGEPKLLLEFRGETLARRAVRAAIEARLGPVFTIVGSDCDGVEKAVAGLQTTIIRNDHWADGMGTSLTLGVEHAEKDPKVEAILVTLADQVLVEAPILVKLAELWRKGGIEAAACRYGAATGVPAIFGRSLFDRLKSLPPHGGAKHILAEASLKLETIDFPDGLADIDTPEDYRRLTGPPAKLPGPLP